MVKIGRSYSVYSGWFSSRQQNEEARMVTVALEQSAVVSFEIQGRTRPMKGYGVLNF